MKKEEIRSNTVIHSSNIVKYQMQIQSVVQCHCHIAYVDLTLKIHSTFISETVKVLQIQLS